ncbi:MAG: ABC transporter substrate-binding protein [Acidimicrobiales bacterium]|nr:ABC transporter substrate-binding protein [Acidimicrobiales bacterium]
MALAIVAAACGDDGGGETSDTTTTTTSTEAPATTEGDTPTTTEAAPDPTDAPIVLTDSFRGVTAESIKIGVPWTDTTFIDWSPSHDAELIWQVAADTINANGGVLGRNIELVLIGVSPIDFVVQDEVCVRLTEDEEVFAVMGVIRNEIPLCYTEQHDTIVINTFQTTQETFDRSLAPIIGFLPLADRQAKAQLDTLISSGMLDGASVALSAAAATLPTADNMAAILADAGIEVVSTTAFEAPSSDQVAIDAEMDIFVEVWKTAGADTVIAVPGASVPTVGALSRNAWDGLTVITDNPGTDVALLEGFGYTTDALVNSVAIVAPSEADLYDADQAGVKECFDTFDNAFDDDPPVELRPEDPQTGVVGAVIRACQALEMLKAVAELAGPELTNESFDAAADAIGEFTVTGVLGGSLGPGKRDFVDAGSAVYEFDEAQRLFVLS